jgi:hypothetical protein
MPRATPVDIARTRDDTLALLRGDPTLSLAEVYRDLQTSGVLPPSRGEFQRLQQIVDQEVRLRRRAPRPPRRIANRAGLTIAANDAAWDREVSPQESLYLLRRSSVPADACDGCGRPMGNDGYCCVRGPRADGRH